MADSPLKVKPIKDLIDEILSDVQPVIEYKIGDTFLEFWKSDHISEKYHLRYVAIQVEQMVTARQYQTILNRLNYLSDLAEITEEERAEIPILSQKLATKQEELMPLNCQFLEALAELESGTLQNLIETELSKRNLRKKIPIAKFINDLANFVRKATDPEPTEETDTDEGDDPLEVEATVMPSEPLPLNSSVKQLESTAST